MTCLEDWRRRSARVEVLEITNPRDLTTAEQWLRQHGVDVVRMHPALLAADAIKWRNKASDPWQYARLGQRLTRDKHSGLFDVQTESAFQASHDQTNGEAL